MKHTTMLVVLVVMLTSVTWSRDKKLVNVKVEVVAQEGMQGSTTQAGGLVGEVEGRQVVTDAWTMRVILNGEHAMLTCYENHNPCHFYAAGTYDGELKTHPHRDARDYAGYSSDPDLWI